MEFEQIWQRIQRLAGETFYELGGKTFTYEASEDHLMPSTSQRPVPRSDFERVYAQGEITNLRRLKERGIRDPSYIFSILTDPRLREGAAQPLGPENQG